MACRLGYSEFNNEPDNSNKPNKRKNKTVRKKRLEEQAPKVTSFLKAMEDGGKDEASDGLADFNPPANPELTKQPGPVQEVKTNDDQSLNIKAFENLDKPMMNHTSNMFDSITLLENQSLDGLTVLDMGCGTGILGILASHLGAKGIMAVDIEPCCIENTIVNAKRNGCEQFLEARLGDVDVVSGAYDLIFANINRNTLLRHISQYSQQLQHQGILLLSGFYVKDLDEITLKCLQNGLSLESQTSLDEWVCAKYVYSDL